MVETSIRHGTKTSLVHLVPLLEGTLTPDERRDLVAALLRMDRIGKTAITTTNYGSTVANLSILRYSSGTLKQYAYSESELISALGASSSGDTIFLPPGTLTLTKVLTIPAGIELVGYINTELTGTVTNNGVLTSLTVTGTLTNNSVLNGVVNPAGKLNYVQSTDLRISPLLVLPAESVAGFLKNNADGEVSGGNSVDISDDTNLSVTSPITLTDDDIGFDFATNNVWTGTNTFNATVVINESGAAEVDTRIEGDTEANMLFVDASADTIYIGGTTNGIKITKGGEWELIGTATRYEDLQVSISNIRLPTANMPTWRTYDPTGGGLNFAWLGFDVGDIVKFDVQTTHAAKLNEVLDNHIHFSLPNTTNIGDRFQFQLDVIAAGINTQWAVPSGSPYTAERQVIANDDTYHRLFEVADIAASNDTVSTIYKCIMTRIAATTDEYGSEVYLTFTDCHQPIDTPGGSQAEDSKTA